MEEFCPLCMKQGLKKKMKAIQINLEEAVWMCESEECVWPMDYKELEYIPRKIGESWSCYWNTYKPNRSSVSESHFEFQPLITPPYTPKTDVSPAVTSDSNIHSSIDTNGLQSTFSEEAITLPSQEVTTSSDTNAPHRDTMENNLVLKNSINTSLLTDNDEKALVDVTDSANSSSESISLDTQPTENISKVLDSSHLAPNPKTFNASVPRITSIEKTNIINIKSLTTRQIIKKVSGENMIHNSSLENSGLKSEMTNLHRTNSTKSVNVVINSPSVKVETVKIAGLPVTLSYEVPLFQQEANNVCKENKNEKEIRTELQAGKRIAVDKCNQPLSKESIKVSQKYAKFSFSALKQAKNLQKNDDSDKEKSLDKSQADVKKFVNETELSNSNLDIVNTVSTDKNASLDNTKSIINDSENTETLPNIDNSSSNLDDAKENIINDLDSILNHFIEESNANINKSMSSNIVDDDWLSSLLV